MNVESRGEFVAPFVLWIVSWTSEGRLYRQKHIQCICNGGEIHRFTKKTRHPIQLWPGCTEMMTWDFCADYQNSGLHHAVDTGGWTDERSCGVSSEARFLHDFQATWIAWWSCWDWDPLFDGIIFRKLGMEVLRIINRRVGRRSPLRESEVRSGEQSHLQACYFTNSSHRNKDKRLWNSLYIGEKIYHPPILANLIDLLK